MRNWKLLNEVALDIIRHPERHDNRYWVNLAGDCGTTYCFAGNTAARSGWRPETAYNEGGIIWANRAGSRELVPVVARELLGLSRNDSDVLFAGANDIRRIARALVRWATWDQAEIEPEVFAAAALGEHSYWLGLARQALPLVKSSDAHWAADESAEQLAGWAVPQLHSQLQDSILARAGQLDEQAVLNRDYQQHERERAQAREQALLATATAAVRELEHEAVTDQFEPPTLELEPRTLELELAGV